MQLRDGERAGSRLWAPANRRGLRGRKVDAKDAKNCTSATFRCCSRENLKTQRTLRFAEGAEKIYRNRRGKKIYHEGNAKDTKKARV
jgi:hypothetical protein